MMESDLLTKPKVEVRAERMFELDALFDGLISGRLCGQAFDPDTAQLLLVLLERLEWTPDPRQLAGALPHFPEEFGVREFRSTLAALGYQSTEARLFGQSLAVSSREALVSDGAALWLPRHIDGKTQLFRPDEAGETVQTVQSKRAYRTTQFARLLVSASSGVPGAQQSWVGETINRFAPELRLLLLLTFLSGCTAVLIAFGITKIFDTVIPTRNYQTLSGILIGLGLVFLFDFKFRRIRADIVGRVSGRLEYILGSALLGKLLRLPGQMLSNVSLSDQLARLRQFESIRDLFGGPVVLLMLELPLALLLLATVALIAWPLAALLAIYVLVFSLGAFLLAPAIRRETRKYGAAQSVLNGVMLEVLEQRQQIGRDGLAPFWLAKIETKVRDLALARRRVTSLSRWLEAMSQASLPFAAASVIGLGAYLAMQGSLTGGSLVAATILTWRLFAPVQQGLLLLPKLQDVQRLFQQIDALMRIPEEESGSESGLHVQRQGNLKTRGVVLRHPKTIAPVLMGVQLEIPHGSFVSVTGRSGSGKTTLLRVLAGQLAPQAGAVLFNDLNLTQLSRGFKARNIAYVSQKPLYIYGSVAQNLRLADPSANDTRLAEVLGELGLSDWVSALPNGLDTRLDPSADAALLSASVLTCLSVAQAFLTNPAVLLLDEAAGNMDVTLEARLVEALERRRGQMTSVVVTHRPSLIRRTDAVIILNAGSAVMRNTAELESRAS